MLLGIGLHASLSFFPSFWPAQDSTSDINGPFDELLWAIHGFRMPVFFLLSGFFTAITAVPAPHLHRLVLTHRLVPEARINSRGRLAARRTPG